MEKIPGASYQTSLAITTRNGAITAATFHTFFVLLYALSGYPLIIVGINFFSLLLDLLSLLLTQRYRNHAIEAGKHFPIAHLITFSIYISLFGPTLFSGGIAASSLVWLTFVPVAGTIMAGRKAGIYWGFVSIGSAIGIYALKESLGVDISLIPVTNFDRLVDILTATLATTAAIWLNETSKSRALKQLEDISARLDHLATTDSLTDTYNRRYFMERARDEVFQSAHAAALLMFDIDHFKKINDDYGHDIGDQVLQGLCKVCKDNLRENDLFARFGGEEFMILLPATNLEKAQQIAERLCRVVGQTAFMTNEGELSTTISIGISTFSPLNQVSIEMLLVQADKAMYQSKRAGRNRVTVWKST
jgi:diguanylate cyclase (GGDEF)-like protein